MSSRVLSPNTLIQKDRKRHKRTARVDKKETSTEVIQHLQSVSEKYLIHRYRVVNDVYRGKFQLETEDQILWLDYSQNIKLTEKRQAQSAHFSGKQQTLHCSLLYPGGNEKTYIYHISDDTNHNNVLTFAVNDVIDKHPGLIANQRLVLQSDN